MRGEEQGDNLVAVLDAATTYCWACGCQDEERVVEADGALCACECHVEGGQAPQVSSVLHVVRGVELRDPFEGEE